MPNTPQFNYFLYTADNVIQRNSPNWKSPLPLSRTKLAGVPAEHSEKIFTIGDYFGSVRDFLIRQGIDTIAEHASKVLDQNVSKKLIEVFRVTLEKHGEFYHPARIDTEICEKKFSFVLNVAVSDPGNDLAEKEYHYLQKLNKTIHLSFLPEVFCLGGTHTKNHQKVSMFLGQWFEGFHEFHMSYDPATGKHRIKIWSPDGGFFLTDDQTAKLYQQAVKILTLYYVFDTYEQILSWHHAAGDFVARVSDNDVSLKLVTVRSYASMFRGSGDSKPKNNTESMLEALLLFLLNISIRMRLDRLDGVGDIVWSDDIAVGNCLLGFYDGLKCHPSGGLQEDFADIFFGNYLSRFSRPMLTDLSASLVDRHYQDIEEIDQIQGNLKAHIQALYASIQLLANPLQKQT